MTPENCLPLALNGATSSSGTIGLAAISDCGSRRARRR